MSHPIMPARRLACQDLAMTYEELQKKGPPKNLCGMRPEDWADAVGEAVMCFLERLHAGETIEISSSPFGLVYTGARNQAISGFRRRRNRELSLDAISEELRGES